MNKKFWVIAETIMLIIWIITTIIFCYAVFSKGAKCMANPLIEGVKQLEIKNNVSFSCNCQFENNLNNVIFVDSKHWEWRNINSQNTYLNLTGGIKNVR